MDDLKRQKLKSLLRNMTLNVQDRQGQEVNKKDKERALSPLPQKDGGDILNLDLRKGWLQSWIDSLLAKSKTGHKIAVAEKLRDYVSLVRDIQQVLYEIKSGRIKHSLIALEEKVVRARMIEEIELSLVRKEIAWLSVEDKKLDIEKKRLELDPSVYNLTRERDKLAAQREIEEIKNALSKSRLELETEIEKLKRTKEKYVR